MNTSFTFTGREWDEDAGLYYYRARYYDASTGRFLQQDPDPGKVSQPATVVNKYVYVGNAPNVFTDPTGKFWWLLLSAVVSFGINYTTAINSGASTGQALISGLIGGVSGLIAPGFGSYLVGKGISAAASLLIGNVAAGVFNGATHAAVFGGNIGQGALLGGLGGVAAGAFQIGAASIIYDIGFNRAASGFLSEPFGFFGGIATNSGQEFSHEEDSHGTNWYRISPEQ